MLRRVDPPSAGRIQPKDLKRIVRALEVFFLTGRPLTAHFAETASPIPDIDVMGIAVRLPAAAISERVTRRVEEQFDRGLLDEIRALLARGIPETARPFGGLVYRQALEHLHGVRDEPATRALIAQENRQYARRQLIWFRKEPNLTGSTVPASRPRRSLPRAGWSKNAMHTSVTYAIAAHIDLQAEPSSSCSTASASASCRTRRSTAIGEATRSDTSRAACRSTCRRCGRSVWVAWPRSVEPRRRPCARGAVGRMAEASAGKDSVTGHWEMMGIVLKQPFPVFSGGFSPDVIAEFSRLTGRGVIGNKAASGTEIIDELGAEHMRTGSLIVYTSADSVFQIAAHEADRARARSCIAPARSRTSSSAKALASAGSSPGRSSARPGAFKRTANRRDYALPPPARRCSIA